MVSVSVNYALFFGFTKTKPNSLSSPSMPGFCKIYRTGISNIILIYFLLSKHFPLKMVFHTQNTSSFCCVPRTPIRTQMPCSKHHFLPSLLQSAHSPVEGGLHRSIKAAKRKHLNLNKAFHLSYSTNRQTQYGSFFSHTRLVLWGYTFLNKAPAALQVKYCEQIHQREQLPELQHSILVKFSVLKSLTSYLFSLSSHTSVKDTTSPMAPTWLNS